MNYKERNAYFARRRAKLKAKGICIICGKADAADNCIRCVTCRQKHRDCQRNRQVEQRLAESGQVTERIAIAIDPCLPPEYQAARYEREVVSWAWSHPA